jgi:hypothetical protein
VSVSEAEIEASEQAYAALAKTNRERLVLWMWRYWLEGLELEPEQVARLHFLKWLYATGRRLRT